MRSTRRGFTLVELMVVILILAILIALLLPAIMGAIRTARDGAVLAEINSLGQALASFKNQYGDYPPSRVVLCENGLLDTTATGTPLSAVTWLGTPPVLSGTDLSYGQLAQRSLTYLRKFFPRAVFASSGNPLFTSPCQPYYDFNGNGQLDNQPILLTGEECLVFFLGGIPEPVSGGVNAIGPSGFNRSPNNPFLSVPEAQYQAANCGTGTSGQTNRTAVMYDFKVNRLVDGDGDGIPGYIDLLGTGDDARYYAYFSAYGQGNYDPNDVNEPEVDPETGVQVGRVFQTTFPIDQTPNQSYLVGSPGPNPYTADLPTFNQNNGQWSPPRIWQNAISCQIVSPGRDRLYGIGGTFQSQNTTDPLPTNDAGAPYNQGWDITPTARTPERDNLTSVSTSRLD